MKKDRKLKRTKRKFIKSNIIKKDRLTKKETKKEVKKFKLNINSSEFINIDKKYSINSYELFIKLNKEESFTNRIKILNELQDIYVNLLKKISYNEDTFATRRQIKEILNYISNRLIFEKSYKIKAFDISNRKINKQTNFKETNINQDNERIIKEILQGNDLSNYSLDEIVYNFNKCIRVKKISDELIKCSYEIISRLDNSKNSEIIIYSILDTIKYRKYIYDKNDFEYIILNQIKKILKKYIKLTNYDNTEVEDETSIYRYNIIFALLFDENDYNLTKSLITKCHNFVNIKIENRHIVCYILEYYLKYLEKLLNKHYDINDNINVDYIREIYLMFINNKNLKLSQEDKIDIISQINLFKEKITSDVNKKTKIINEKKYNTILIKNENKKENIIEKLDKLLPYMQTKNLKLRNFKDYELETQIKYFINNKFINEHYHDNSDKENIILGKSFVSYNYNKEDKILRINIPDISCLIDEDTPLDYYLYNMTITKEKIDKRIIDELVYKDFEEMPSITFKICLDKNNNPINLYIYRSKIIPTTNTDSQTYKDLQEDFNSPLEETLDKILNQAYLTYVTNNDIPYIYSGVEDNEDFNKDTFVKISSMSQIFDDEEYNKIYEVLISTDGEFHYSNKEFKTKKFNLNLTKPNYITLLNIRIIKKLIFNTLDNDIKEYIKEEVKELINNLNESLGYKDPKKLFKKVIRHK